MRMFKNLRPSRILAMLFGLGTVLIQSTGFPRTLSYPGLEIGKNTCNLPEEVGKQYITFRGIGYYWSEYQFTSLVTGN